jgi:predicted acyl esterase
MKNGEIKRFDNIVIKDFRIPMRDGIELAVRVYLPSETGEYPTLYCASPYQYDTDHLPDSAQFPWYEVGPLEWYVKEQGYAFVHLDVRGSGHSEGDWDPWSPTEREDHREVLAWLVEQPWCSGKVGTHGQSYYAMSQWTMATSGSPHISCMGVYDGSNDIYRSFVYRGGIAGGFANMWVNLVTHSNATRMDTSVEGRVIRNPIPDFTKHNTDDDFWRERSPLWNLEGIDIPLYTIGLWGKRDIHLQGNLDGYRLMGGEKKLLVLGSLDVQAAHHLYLTKEFHREYMLPFYDHYLKGADNGWQETTPDVKLWIYGRESFREDVTWPPSAVSGEEVLYLSEGPTASINSLNDGRLTKNVPQISDSKTQFSYPDLNWDLGNVAFGQFGPDAQRFNCTYTSDELEDDMEIVGEPRLILYLSSTQIDTDLIVRLQEQSPCPEEEVALGKQPGSTLVAKGLLKASHRGLDREWSAKLARPFPKHRDIENLVPGQVYKLEVAFSGCGHLFKKGNRLRLDISNAESPVTDSIFAAIYHWEKVGTDTYYHSSDYPSRVILPKI